jgi:hypothetical protein
MKTETKECAVCKELIKKIELEETNYEAAKYEVALYQHKIKDSCHA